MQRWALTTFSSLHVMVAMLPATVLAVAADKGGLPDAHGVDLLLASAVVGVAHAVVVRRRLLSELREGTTFLDAMLAEFNALVVLAVAATGLFFVVLGGLASEHSAMVNQGWPVIGLWVSVLLGAVVVAELVRTGVLRWLAAEDRGE